MPERQAFGSGALEQRLKPAQLKRMRTGAADELLANSRLIRMPDDGQRQQGPFVRSYRTQR